MGDKAENYQLSADVTTSYASDYTIVIDAAVMDGGNKDSINTTKENDGDILP